MQYKKCYYIIKSDIMLNQAKLKISNLKLYPYVRNQFFDYNKKRCSTSVFKLNSRLRWCVAYTQMTLEGTAKAAAAAYSLDDTRADFHYL